jgi:hypothetical protein
MGEPSSALISAAAVYPLASVAIAARHTLLEFPVRIVSFFET